MEVSLLLLLPKVATAGKSVCSLGSELGLLLRHENPYSTLRPLPSFTAIRLYNRAPFPPFAICHPEVNNVISKLSYVDEGYVKSVKQSIIYSNLPSNILIPSPKVWNATRT